MIARLQGRVDSAPGWAPAALLLLTVVLVAGLTRLVGLATITPGFGIEEATQVLFSRQITAETFPIFFGQESAVSEPFLPYFIRLASETGLSTVVAARLPMALAGIGTVLACTLWYRRAFGAWWGLAGGLLIATSFWQLMFSRQATPEIGTALFTATGLWCLWEGVEKTDRSGTRVSVWHILAGIAFAGAFYVDIVAIPIPGIVLVMVPPLIGLYQRQNRNFDGIGVVVMLGVALVALSPLASYYLDNPDAVRQNLELSGGIPERLTEGQQGVSILLDHLFWRGPSDPAANLPGRPFLHPILTALIAAGFVTCLVRPLRPVHAVALIWVIFSIVPSALLDPENPAMLLPLTPVLFAFPPIAMKEAIDLIQRHRPRFTPIVTGAITLIIAISAIWSMYDYFGLWSNDERVYRAMRGDHRAAIEAAGNLGDDIPIYLSTGDNNRIARALAPDLTYRPIRDPDVLPMPAQGGAFIVYPRSLEPHAMLLPYFGDRAPVETGEGPDGEMSYQIRYIDQRTREGLPRSIPAVRFNNRWQLPAWELLPAQGEDVTSPAVDLMLAWRVPADADPMLVEGRLRPPSDADRALTRSAQQLVRPWKDNPYDLEEILLVHLRLDYPQTEDLIVNLQAGLRHPNGTLEPPVHPETLIQDSYYAFLNRIGLTAGEPEPEE